MSASLRVLAPQVFAPTQRAPSPAWPVIRASSWHLTGAHVKVHWNGRLAAVARFYGLDAIIFAVICSKSLLAVLHDARLLSHVQCGLEVFRSRCQNLGKFEVTHGDLQLVWICHAGDVCVCVNSDVNECEDARLCVGGQCTNAIGSYSCSCPSGMELVDGTFCRGINMQMHYSSKIWN